MKATVFIIEDNQENLYLAKFILESNGCHVRCANCGREALELAPGVHPDLMLLDVSLPDMDGCDVASALRQIAGFERIPILAFTAHAMPGDRERFLAAGCTGYIEKPIVPEVFMKDIERHLRTAPSPKEDNPRSRTVLVVDDMAETRYQLRVLLRSKGFEVLEAADGSEALKKAHEAMPDLIISDILMPSMDGFALCRACKKDPELKSVPFVFTQPHSLTRKTRNLH
ncbi:MAG: response regulator [Verrucomicrobiota bacterium]|nr:response regulator [Verrucomicrobiota bacterium]